MIRAKVGYIVYGDGACPPSLAGKLGPAGFAEHGIPTEGEAGGLSIKLVCKVGEGVLARFGRTDGRFEMVITHCNIFEPPADQLEKRKEELKAFCELTGIKAITL